MRPMSGSQQYFGTICMCSIFSPASHVSEGYINSITHLRHLLLHDGFDALDSVEICLPFSLPPPSQEGKSADPLPPVMILVLFYKFSIHVSSLSPPFFDNGFLVDHGAVLQIGRIGTQKHPLEYPPAAHQRGRRPGGLGRPTSIEHGRDGGFAPGEFEDEEKYQGSDHGEERCDLDLPPGGHVFLDLFDQCALDEQLVQEGRLVVVVQGSSVSWHVRIGLGAQRDGVLHGLR